MRLANVSGDGVVESRARESQTQIPFFFTNKKRSAQGECDHRDDGDEVMDLFVDGRLFGLGPQRQARDAADGGLVTDLRRTNTALDLAGFFLFFDTQAPLCVRFPAATLCVRTLTTMPFAVPSGTSVPKKARLVASNMATVVFSTVRLTGSDSPVSDELFTDMVGEHSQMRMSAGTRSPASNSTTSPIVNSKASTSICSPAREKDARFSFSRTELCFCNMTELTQLVGAQTTRNATFVSARLVCVTHQEEENRVSRGAARETAANDVDLGRAHGLELGHHIVALAVLKVGEAARGEDDHAEHDAEIQVLRIGHKRVRNKTRRAREPEQHREEAASASDGSQGGFEDIFAKPPSNIEREKESARPQSKVALAFHETQKYPLTLFAETQCLSTLTAKTTRRSAIRFSYECCVGEYLFFSFFSFLERVALSVFSFGRRGESLVFDRARLERAPSSRR